MPRHDLLKFLTSGPVCLRVNPIVLSRRPTSGLSATTNNDFFLFLDDILKMTQHVISKFLPVVQYVSGMNPIVFGRRPTSGLSAFSQHIVGISQ